MPRSLELILKATKMGDSTLKLHFIRERSELQESTDVGDSK